MPQTGLLTDIATYYSEKIAVHGTTPGGVDWNDEASHLVRFEQLCSILNLETPDFSINDLGCGYGALLDWLQDRHVNCSYLGVDIAHAMIKAARQRHAINDRTRFITSAKPDQRADYSVANGIFNVRLKHTDTEWFQHLRSTLELLDHTSRIGFAFNCLTAYADENKKRDYLYYADPHRLFDLCQRCYSGQVELLDDYGLYEFTIRIRKTP